MKVKRNRKTDVLAYTHMQICWIEGYFCLLPGFAYQIHTQGYRGGYMPKLPPNETAFRTMWFINSLLTT